MKRDKLSENEPELETNAASHHDLGTPLGTTGSKEEAENLLFHWRQPRLQSSWTSCETMIVPPWIYHLHPSVILYFILICEQEGK